MWIIQLNDGTRYEYASVVRAVAEWNLYKWRGARLICLPSEKNNEKGKINNKNMLDSRSQTR